MGLACYPIYLSNMIDSITDQLVPEAYNHKNIKEKENNKFLKFYRQILNSWK